MVQEATRNSSKSTLPPANHHMHTALQNDPSQQCAGTLQFRDVPLVW